MHWMKAGGLGRIRIISIFECYPFKWSADIMYVPTQHGFMYPVAIPGWFGRYVLAWQLSNTFSFGKNNLLISRS
ncbi:MAG: hypothetical protein Kow0063_42530 [Anaerolineae bacterium]